MEGEKVEVGECSHIAIEHRSSEGVGDDLVLECNHKIFLSHSGVQKEFVEHLCQALEDCCHYPFFDRRRESLPKGKEFPSLIIKAARQCQLLVVVVSEDYFMSKWPMIELNAFIQAKKVLKSNTTVAILPLFYGLSVSDLKDEKSRQRWLEKWETFAKDDLVEGRIKVEDWSFAIDELTKFNGLSYDRELKRIVAYENEIVSHICELVPSDVKWHDSHVHGNAHEVLFDKMKQIGLSRKYKVKVVGIYGVGGIGKTTTCKTLCNELSSEYEGRVCHIEFDKTCSNSKELWQNAVMKLIRKRADFVYPLNEGECKDVLHKTLHKQQTFLAIDNVWDHPNSIKHAKMFLETPSHNDSLVLVTARSKSTLDLLGIDGDACLEMPELGQADATSLFLYYAARGEQFTTKEDVTSIDWCVKKCYFCKGDGRDYHYHPLALEALGRQVCCFKEKPLQWVQRLSGVWKSSSFFGENVVFDVLRSSFDLLQRDEQTLFMDVGFFLPCMKENHTGLWGPGISWKEQLCVVLYRKGELEVQSQLDSLKRKGLLQDADLKLGRISMHDLYHEFVKLEAVGKLGGALDMWDRKWVLVDGDHGDLLELEVTPSGGCWQRLSRLFIWQTVDKRWVDLPLGYHPPANPITSLECIEWQCFSNVLILQLYGLVFVCGSLNLKGMKCLRSLQLHDFGCLKTLEGLESLKHLTYFEWKYPCLERGVMVVTHVVGQFPSSLKYLYIDGRCVLSGSNVLVQCNNLIKLHLIYVEVGEVLDLSNCSSLESVEMCSIYNLKTLSGLTSRLHTLDIRHVHGIHIPGLDKLDGLVRLCVTQCGDLWEVPCLLSLTKLQALEIGKHSKPAEHCIPHQLQELHYESWTKWGGPCLNAFKQLQVLNFSGSTYLKYMGGMGDLLALRSLNLLFCQSLRRLPNLSKSRSLEELNLNYCNQLELHEEDFEMLASLPLLHPVLFSVMSGLSTYRLDIAGRKVLRYRTAYCCPDSWEEGEWEELELVPPPVKIGFIGSAVSNHPL